MGNIKAKPISNLGDSSTKIFLELTYFIYMHILVLTTSFPTNEKSSVGIFILNQCVHLVEQGVEVTVLAPHYPGSKKSESINGVKVRRFYYMFPLSWQRLCYGAGMEPNMRERFRVRLLLAPFFFSFFLYTLWLTRKVDILHCHWSPAGFVGTVIGKFILRKPTIYMEHHGTVTTSHTHSFILSWILRNVDYVFANSSFTLKEMLKLASPKRYTIIPPGIDISRFRIEERTDKFYIEVGFKRDIPLLLSVGRFIEVKGFHYLVEAIDILVHHMNQLYIQLLLVGNGPLRPGIERMVCEKKLEPNIHLMSNIRPEDMPRFYSHADIVIAPSIVDDHGNTEGLGLTLIEANACSVPCIASQVGGITDVIADGVNGLLVEEKNPKQLAESIYYLLRHQKEREKMGDAGRRMVSRKYDDKSIAKRLVQCYEEIK